MVQFLVSLQGYVASWIASVETRAKRVDDNHIRTVTTVMDDSSEAYVIFRAEECDLGPFVKNQAVGCPRQTHRVQDVFFTCRVPKRKNVLRTSKIRVDGGLERASLGIVVRGSDGNGEHARL